MKKQIFYNISLAAYGVFMWLAIVLISLLTVITILILDGLDMLFSYVSNLRNELKPEISYKDIPKILLGVIFSITEALGYDFKAWFKNQIYET